MKNFLNRIRSDYFLILLLLSLNLIISYLVQKIFINLDKNIFIDSELYFLSSLNNSLVLLLLVAIILFIVFNFKKISWSHFENKKEIRVFVLILSSTIFLQMFFLDYNYYLDTNNIYDKALLLIFFVAIYFSPLFIPLFVFQSLLIKSSLYFPIGLFGWTDIRPSYDILILFTTFLLLKNFHKFKLYTFFIIAFAMHASNYFIPGVGKLEISPNLYEWTFLDNINNLFVSSYFNGWLGFIDQQIIINIALFLNKIDFLITIPTMIIQLGAILLLISRRVSILFFILFEFLHIGIFLASGILFWVWILVNLGFLILVKSKNTGIQNLYTKKSLVIFLFIVLASPLFFRPVALAWWDSSVFTTYDFYAVTSEDKIKINRNSFTPYDTIFSQNRFYYIDNNPTTTGTFGNIQRDDMKYAAVTKNNGQNDSYEIYKKYESAQNISEIEMISKNFGVNSYDKKREEDFVNFIKIYFHNHNKNRRVDSFFVGAPYHIYDLSTKRLITKEKIEKIKIRKKEFWWDKNSKTVVNLYDEYIKEISIE